MFPSWVRGRPLFRAGADVSHRYQLFSMLFHQGLQGNLFTILSRYVCPSSPPAAPLTPLPVVRTNRSRHHRRPCFNY